MDSTMVFGTIDHGSIPYMGFIAVGTHATDLHWNGLSLSEHPVSPWTVVWN